MKNGFFCTVLLLCGIQTAVFGQFERGNWLVDGYLSGTYSLNTASLQVAGEVDPYSINVGFSASNFLKNGTAVGGTLGFSKRRNLFVNFSSSQVSVIQTASFGFHLDNYYKIGSEGFFFFGRSNYSASFNSERFTSNGSSSKSTFLSQRLAYSPGLGFLVNDRFGLKLNFGAVGLSLNESNLVFGSPKRNRLDIFLDASLRAFSIGGFFIFNTKNDAE